MDAQFQKIRAGTTLPSESARQIVASGFAAVSGPISGERLEKLAVEYDRVMGSGAGPVFSGAGPDFSGAGPDFKVASTTTRMSDLLSHSSVFDDVFVYPPLLEACALVIGEPFKLSSLLGRTLRGGTPAQELHADLARDSEDAPLFGFILMIDPFRRENGATRFIPGSHCWPGLPADELSDTRADYDGEVLGRGDAGAMILFNGATWHGHTANVTPHPRRSIQGYFVRRDARSGFDFRDRMPPACRTRMGHLARYLLSLDG